MTSSSAEAKPPAFSLSPSGTPPMPHRNENLPLQDTVLASSLVTAPAWASWLADINQILTTLTLAAGLVLGAARLWFFIADRRRKTVKT